MAALRTRTEDRVKAAVVTALVQGALGYALITGLAVRFGQPPDDELKVLDLAPPPPKPLIEKEPRPKKASPRREGEASPPNLRAEPKPIVAPPVVIPPPPPPILAAPIAGVGTAPWAGSAALRGPGTGSGGIGNGRGSGGAGDGDGGGGGEETPPRLIRGRLSDADFPRELGEAGIGGTVSVRYVVEADGRVSRCRATRSSGSRELDALTCRLIEQRFRFRPSLDARGVPVTSTIVENHTWVVEDDPEPPPERRRRGW